MRILDKYIVVKIFKSYVYLLIGFIFLYIISDIFSRLDDLLKEHTPLTAIIQYYYYSIPYILVKVSSFSLLISSLYILGSLNKTNEILAIRASGISIRYLAFSIVTLAVVLGVISLFVHDKIVPRAHAYTKQINIKQKGKISKEKRNNLAFLGENGMIFFVGMFDPESGLLSNVTMFQHNRKGKIIRKIVAKEVAYKPPYWESSNAIFYTIDPEGKENLVSRYFDKKVLDIKETPQDINVKSREGYEMMSLKEIRDQIQQFKLIGAQGLLIPLRIEIQKKIAEAFNHVFLVLGVLPFALKIRKRHVNFSLMGMAIIFSLVYYVIFSISIAVGKIGLLPPELSVWIANVFFGVSGIVGLADLR